MNFSSDHAVIFCCYSFHHLYVRQTNTGVLPPLYRSKFHLHRHPDVQPRSITSIETAGAI